jgi:hypothetical protein
VKKKEEKRNMAMRARGKGKGPSQMPSFGVRAKFN